MKYKISWNVYYRLNRVLDAQEKNITLQKQLPNYWAVDRQGGRFSLLRVLPEKAQDFH